MEPKMAKKSLSDRTWIMLLIAAVGLIVACSSSTTEPEDSGAGKDGPASMTKG
jgi:hypothetical protein